MESFKMESKKPAYLEMGDRIRQAREALTTLDQAGMTKALGLKDPTYGNYERGNRKMPPHIMGKFQKLTGCSADWIYLGIGSMKAEDNEFLTIMSKIDDPQIRAELKSLALDRLLAKK